MKIYLLITFSFVLLNVIHAVNWMDFHTGSLSNTDILMQKSLRYKHHKQNYTKSLEEEITPVGLKIKNKLAFQPVSEDFEFKWNSIIFNAEQSIVQLLLYESEKVIGKIEFEIQEEFNEKSPEKLKQWYADLEKKHSDLQSKLEKRRRKKWKKFIERNDGLNNTKEIITCVGGSEVLSSVTQLSTVNQPENVRLVELGTTTPKYNESLNTADKESG